MNMGAGSRKVALARVLVALTCGGCTVDRSDSGSPHSDPPIGNGGSETFVPPAVCGNARVEGGEECDDGNDDPEDGCSQCRSIAVAAWPKSIPGVFPWLDPRGFIYSFDVPDYGVNQIDLDGKLVAKWSGSLVDLNVSTFVSYHDRVFPLGNGDVLSIAQFGQNAVDVHAARYSSNGHLNWAVFLPHESFNSLDAGRYVEAVAASGSTIVLAGMQHLGNGGTGNTALITVLDPDGVEQPGINYSYMDRETAAQAVTIVSEHEICAAGAQWLVTDAKRSGWVACFVDGVPLWERSLDAPVLALGPIDAGSFDVFTTTALSTIQLADGIVSNRRAINVTFNDPITLAFDKNVLVVDQGSAHIFDQTGAAIWTEDDFPGMLAGIAPTGEVYWWSYDNIATTTLNRVESGITWQVPTPPAPVVSSTTDISDSSVNESCVSFCVKAMTAGCDSLLDTPLTTTPECVTACLRPARCPTEFKSVVDCVASAGSVSCGGSTPAFSGCDEESQALMTCESKPGVTP
jgi:cysteine-rich repeat protein